VQVILPSEKLEANFERLRERARALAGGSTT